MHQPHSQRTARAMKLGARSFALLIFSFIATVALLSYAIYDGERFFAFGALASFGFTVTLFILHRVYAAAAHCPLCRGPVLAGSGAQRHRNAKRTLGSHRLRVTRDIIFANSFICPYCNEPTECVVKARPKRGQVVKRRSAHRR